MQLVFDEFSEKLKTSLEDLTWGGIDERLKRSRSPYESVHYLKCSSHLAIDCS